MATPANDLVQACGCGPDPGFLFRRGVFATAFLVLGMIVLTALAGWVLATLVWLAGWRGRRARARARRPVPDEEAVLTDAGRLLAGFTRYEDDPPP
ncbi:hypothetical protein ACIP3D_19775 [Streptomyces longwoodensis]|uniref:hypothetical protein n=1 Tax=Streptomyces longwoodensis TaxID=68231 RepID=UPI00380E987A